MIKELANYILSRSKTTPGLHEKLQKLLLPTAESHTGLILTERLINVPTEIVPPMYKMLLEEITWAIEDVCPLPSPPLPSLGLLLTVTERAV